MPTHSRPQRTSKEQVIHVRKIPSCFLEQEKLYAVVGKIETCQLWSCVKLCNPSCLGKTRKRATLCVPQPQPPLDSFRPRSPGLTSSLVAFLPSLLACHLGYLSDLVASLPLQTLVWLLGSREINQGLPPFGSRHVFPLRDTHSTDKLSSVS